MTVPAVQTTVYSPDYCICVLVCYICCYRNHIILNMFLLDPYSDADDVFSLFFFLLFFSPLLLHQPHQIGVVGYKLKTQVS